jgi:hypothetical protein
VGFPREDTSTQGSAFGRRQLAWKCHQLNATELFPDGIPQIAYSTLNKPRVGTILKDPSLQYSLKGTQKAYSLWQKMVGAYSRCSLTRSEDKLVALSGIAQCIRDVTRDEYMAGMWRRTMAFDLPWWREVDVRKSIPNKQTPTGLLAGHGLRSTARSTSRRYPVTSLLRPWRRISPT